MVRVEREDLLVAPHGQAAGRTLTIPLKRGRQRLARGSVLCISVTVRIELCPTSDRLDAQTLEQDIARLHRERAEYASAHGDELAWLATLTTPKLVSQ